MNQHIVKYFLSGLIILLIPGIVLSINIDLSNARFDAVVEVGPDEIIKGNLTGFGASVSNYGKIKGDFQAIGADVYIPGTVNGDVSAFGARVEISGDVNGDMEVGCASLEIDGNVNGKLTGGGAVLDLSGNFGDDVEIGGAVIRLSGNYGGDVKIDSENVEISPNTNISGDLLYSARDIDIPDGATIGGEVKHFVPVEPEKKKENPYLAYLYDVLWKIGAYFLIGLILWIIIPAKYETILSRITEKPFKSLLWGVLSLIVLPIIAIILMVTFIGIPAGIFIAILYFILVYTSQVIGGTYIGHWVLRLFKKTEEVNLFLSMLIGVVIYAIVASIPFFGWLVFLASAIFAVGAALSMVWLIREKTV